MAIKTVNSRILLEMLDMGAKNLAADCEYVNSINVFPIPDGDTGTNMKSTISGGVREGKNLINEPIGVFSLKFSRASVLSARGNSGVILSQFFKGLSMGLDGKDEVNIKGFAEAMKSGTAKAYSVVSNPTEGTMLTVMREAGEKACSLLKDGDDLEKYLNDYVEEAKASLSRTPELLPTLKKAGVVDSGGAGFLRIAEGMLKYLRGEEIGDVFEEIAATQTPVSVGAFDADSELTFGYCTEFILQLQNKKVNTKTFELKTITDFLDFVGGNSVVAFKDDDIIKVHVHTFDPGKVLSEFRKYGEYLTIKIENMNLQHSENEEFFKDMTLDPLKPQEVKERKPYATVVVAAGEGVKDAFLSMGVDEVVSGGQTMNTSTGDFLETFDKLNADNIIVYPNNSNIKMAAGVAAESYKKANVIVMPTRSISEGYSAVTMLDTVNEDRDEMIASQKEVIDNVGTLEVTYSIRKTNVNGIDIDEGDFICIYNGDLVSADKSRYNAIIKALDKIEDFGDKQVVTAFLGKDADGEEFERISEEMKKRNPFIEVGEIDGKQDVYSYIIGIE